MADTKIEWADKVWNPVRGCSRVSDGCRHCYAERQAMRQSGIGGKYHGLVRITNGHPQWTGKVVCDTAKLDDPRHWRQPARIFVNSMSDLFHPEVPDDFILKVWGVFADCPQHQFLVLTKRPERMRQWVSDFMAEVALRACRRPVQGAQPPLQNVWLGVSVENQQTADERIPPLLKTPAAIRWISAEPLLGPINLCALDVQKMVCVDSLNGVHGVYTPFCGKNESLKWVVCGGESGPGARPMYPDWVRNMRDQCELTRVPFFFKQWGEWTQWEPKFPVRSVVHLTYAGGQCSEPTGISAAMAKVGKKKAGRLLDGREWNEFPVVTP